MIEWIRPISFIAFDTVGDCLKCNRAFNNYEGAPSFFDGEGRIICLSCANIIDPNKAREPYPNSCESCKQKIIQRNNILEHDGFKYCGSCYENLRENCSRCTQLYPIRYRTNGICPACNNGERLFFKSKLNELKGSRLEFLNTPRRYGVELESCKGRILPHETIFSAVSDGSIAGSEFVSPILSHDEGLDVIKTLCDLKPQSDGRCGFHLHMDATDLSIDEVLSIARTYKRFQTFFFSLVAPSRNGNRYCCKIETPYERIHTEKDLLMSLYGHTTRRSPDEYGKYGGKRYEFLNVNSYFFRGTLELRLHHGTFEFEEIRDWISLNLDCMEIFKNNSPMLLEELLTVLCDYNSYNEEILLRRVERYSPGTSKDMFTLFDKIKKFRRVA